ncbi:MAG: diguanylate cyclase [Lachnospiraceae bacterium]|nr:diguanylate cyclase [Lachnospiraceae bacterium]
MEELKDLEELKKISQEDYMTGLLNRRGGITKITEYIEENPDTKCAFIIFDGDNFKKINDTFGHQCGDNVIISSAQEINRQFSGKGIIFRLGGDEFVVFYRDVDVERLKIKLDEFITLCNKASVIGGRKVAFTFSIGVSIYPDDGRDFDELMKRADDALYKAKYDGKARCCFYKKNMAMPVREQFMFDLDEFSRGLPGGFFVYEASGDEQILYVGDSLVKMYNCRNIDEFRNHVGNSFKGMIHPDDLERAEKEIYEQQFNTPQNVNRMDYVRYRIICKDGEIKTVDDYGHLVHDINYGMVYYVFLLDLEDHIFKETRA